MERLQAEGVACAAIDITAIGTSEITPEQWYVGMINRIIRPLKLHRTIDLNHWWTERSLLSSVQRFGTFIEEVMLEAVPQDIVIFIDEIDSVLSLPFKPDDFFALIRECYNQRADKPAYRRLTFALIGVATPSDLIQDKNRTPFNIGRPIELTGFQLHESESLTRGLATKTSDPQAVMQAVLEWTGGQPFLTQKVCKLLLAESDAPSGREAEWVEDLVRARVVENWESQDEPPHLRPIRDRLLRSGEQRMGRLLGLYQQIAQQGEVAADDSPEQIELRLTGLVVRREGKLKVYNRIYALVFDRDWLDKLLAELRPYAASFTAWVDSGYEDESRLLRGQALQDAQAWAAGKSLSDRDYQFLAASEKLDKRDVQKRLEAEAQAKQVLAEAHRKASLELALADVRLRSAASKELFLSGQILRALLEALRTGQQLKQLDKSAQRKDDTQTWVMASLEQAVCGVREHNSLERHQDLVFSVSFSPDGKTLVSGSDDNTIKLWSLDGRQLHILTGHQCGVNSVSFSPDGKTLASGSEDRTIKLWSLDGRELHTFTGHRGRVFSVSFSPDGKTLASGSEDYTIKLWSLNGRELRTFTGHRDRVFSVSFSPDGKTLVSRSAAGTIELWSLDGRGPLTLKGHQGRVFSVSFSPDGKTLASGSFDCTIKLWNWDFDSLMALGCDWIHDYLMTNPNVSESDHQMCGITGKRSN